MRLRNPFTTDTRNLFLYEFGCWGCGRSDLGLELHHLHGRESNSPLNACLICPRCHSKGQRDVDFRGCMHKKILDFLETRDYTFTDDDNAFYDKYYETEG